jgi:UDP-N-acetyl-D-mannosaminuronic acid dehydrogenase
MLDSLSRRIASQKARLAVCGLGYVGLPVACAFAQAGFNVVGIERRKERVSKINSGTLPIGGREPGLADLLSKVAGNNKFNATEDYSALSESDVIFVCVDTPIDEKCQPDYRSLSEALNEIGGLFKLGALVIIESTTAPGTVEYLALPLLEKSSGRRANVDFFLGACPERLTSGKLLENLRTRPRVVGGLTPRTSEVMAELYRYIVKGPLHRTNCVTAEMVKTAENAERDVQIAFSNEIARICEKVGCDARTVRRLVNESTNRNMLVPGSGVGGHCIPKDPWLLVAAARNIPLSVIPAARASNDFMPLHMADLTEKALSVSSIRISEARLLIMGYAYRENTDDCRNSPTAVLTAELERRGAQLVIHDPHVPSYKKDLGELKGQIFHGALFMVNHDAYRQIKLTSLKEILPEGILIDGRQIFDPGEMIDAGFKYYGIGYPS